MPLLSIVGGKGLTSWVARRSFVAMQWASRRQPSGFRAINEQRWIEQSFRNQITARLACYTRLGCKLMLRRDTISMIHFPARRTATLNHDAVIWDADIRCVSYPWRTRNDEKTIEIDVLDDWMFYSRLFVLLSLWFSNRYYPRWFLRKIPASHNIRNSNGAALITHDMHEYTAPTVNTAPWRSR